MNPIAILISDLHLQLRTPKGREETNWLDVLTPMAAELKSLANQYQCPVFMAGDLFDNWAPPIEVINWAIDNLPCMYAIPGQHDLPAHNYEGRHRGAYGTLIRAGTITDLSPGYHTRLLNEWTVVAAPWGTLIPPAPGIGPSLLVAHTYAASGRSTAYTGSEAPPIQNTVNGYTTALYGDNHIPWQMVHNGTNHFNHGCWVRRSRSERDYPTGGPGLLWPDGTVTRQPYVMPEMWADDSLPSNESTGLQIAARYLKFVSACRAARTNSIDFIGKLTTAGNKAGGAVAGVLAEVREHCANQRNRT